MKKVIAISFLLVFSFLQYGKMISYLYCELQAEVSSIGTASCDCEKIITEKTADTPQAPLSHSHSFKEKLSEPFTMQASPFESKEIIINTSCFFDYSPELLSGFVFPPYHPPAILA